MQQYTLDDIRQAAEKKYGTVKIALDENTSVELVNVLRLPKEKRDAVLELRKKLSDEDETEMSLDEQVGILNDLLRTVSKSDSQADTLLSALDGDLALTMIVFEKYMEDSEAGEASGSQS